MFQPRLPIAALKTPGQIISQALLEISVNAQHGSEVTTLADTDCDTNPDSRHKFSKYGSKALMHLMSQA
jgi:hypothetical protein